MIEILLGLGVCIPFGSREQEGRTLPEGFLESSMQKQI